MRNAVYVGPIEAEKDERVLCPAVSTARERGWFLSLRSRAYIDSCAVTVRRRAIATEMGNGQRPIAIMHSHRFDHRRHV